MTDASRAFVFPILHEVRLSLLTNAEYGGYKMPSEPVNNSITFGGRISKLFFKERKLLAAVDASILASLAKAMK